MIYYHLKTMFNQQCFIVFSKIAPFCVKRNNPVQQIAKSAAVLTYVHMFTAEAAILTS